MDKRKICSHKHMETMRHQSAKKYSVGLKSGRVAVAFTFFINYRDDTRVYLYRINSFDFNVINK